MFFGGFYNKNAVRPLSLYPRNITSNIRVKQLLISLRSHDQNHATSNVRGVKKIGNINAKCNLYFIDTKVQRSILGRGSVETFLNQK